MIQGNFMHKKAEKAAKGVKTEVMQCR